MRVFRILFLALSVAGLFSVASAQADCLRSFRLKITDHQEIPLKNARVKFRGRNLDYDGEEKAYKYSTVMGCNSVIKGLLEFSAPGFNSFKGELELNGGTASYWLKPGAKKSKQVALLEQLAIISGTVKDENEGAIPQTRVLLTGAAGKRIEVFTNANGSFRLDVKDGKYTLKFTGPAGFMVRKFENIELTKGFKNFDVVLPVRPCDDCEWIEGTPVEENKKPK